MEKGVHDTEVYLAVRGLGKVTESGTPVEHERLVFRAGGSHIYYTYPKRSSELTESANRKD